MPVLVPVIKTTAIDIPPSTLRKTCFSQGDLILSEFISLYKEPDVLSPYRVLDLTDERGLLCGQILADLGADVVAVETPAGNAARHRGPFAGEGAHPERSLTWWAYSRGKRSIALDLEKPGDQSIFRQLVRTADFLIESDEPGRMAALSLGYEDLAHANPALIYVSVSAFGQDGPKAGYVTTDLIVSAASGVSILMGDEDRAPLRFGVPQAFHHAAAEAAGAALVALYERQRSGLGQHVDVSAQQCFALASDVMILAAANGTRETGRVRGGVQWGPTYLPLVWRARDGYVSLMFSFGASIGPFSRRLMQWIYEEGLCDKETRDKDWIRYGGRLWSGAEPREEYKRVLDLVARFLQTKTKRELLAASLERRLLIAPIATFQDLIENQQLSARDYWHDIEQPNLTRPARHPGAFARFDRKPVDNWRPAPLLDEHGPELRAECATAFEVAARDARRAADRPPLAGLKVLDLTWALAAPAAIRVLADYGATVVKVESTAHPDTARTTGPFPGDRPNLECSLTYHDVNAGKLGVTLDLSQKKGREILLDLVRWADVVAESFSPRVMRGWGLDYPSLRAVNPRLIMLSSTLFGQSGPLAAMAGFGTMAAAISGFASVVGWPDREPVLVTPYTDFVAPRFSAVAVLAALDHRERTGEGQYIDLSQAEASLQFLAPEVLDYTVNGRETGRTGNSDAQMAPHGVYPAAGEDRWIAIAVATNPQWRGFCEAIGRPQLSDVARFVDIEQRLAHLEELDAIVAEWTRGRTAEAAEAELQRRGVPAHSVDGSSRLVLDPQLLHRGHFVRLERKGHPPITIEDNRTRLSRTPVRVERAGPTIGGDNEAVLSQILGYDEDRIAALAAAGVLR